MEPKVDGGVDNSSQSVMGPKSSFIEILPFDALRMRIGTIDLWDKLHSHSEIAWVLSKFIASDNFELCLCTAFGSLWRWFVAISKLYFSPFFAGFQRVLCISRRLSFVFYYSSTPAMDEFIGLWLLELDSYEESQYASQESVRPILPAFYYKSPRICRRIFGFQKWANLNYCAKKECIAMYSNSYKNRNWIW